jgi:hypothetical protein
MAEARLQNELFEDRNEIKRLPDSMSIGTPTFHKDMSMITLVPKWTGYDSTVTLEKFLSSIEAGARIGRWEDND